MRGLARRSGRLASRLARPLLLRRLRSLLGLRQLDGNRAAVFDDLNAAELAEELRQLVGAVTAHVEVGVALEQTASHLAHAGRLPVVLVVGDDVDHGLLDLLNRGARILPALRIALVAMAFALAALAVRIPQQKLERGEDVARLAKSRGGFLLPHADHRQPALADAAGQAREVAVARHDAEPLHRARVQDVHRVDDHGRVRGVLPLRVPELLNGRDRVFQKRVLPFRMKGERPIAVDALVGDGAVFGQFVGDGLDVLRRYVVGIDEQCESFFRRWLYIHKYSLMVRNGLNAPSATPCSNNSFAYACRLGVRCCAHSTLKPHIRSKLRISRYNLSIFLLHSWKEIRILPPCALVGVVQSARTPDCGSGGRGFESHHPPQRKFLKKRSCTVDRNALK